MLLAIDTATQFMSLALHDGNQLIAEQTWRTGNKHNVLLAVALDTMLNVCDVPHSELTVLAVCTGPGSYTGLRIGVALAKGMAAARQLPLVGVSSLDILAAAQPFQNTRTNLIATVQAGRGRIIAAEYQVKKGRWTAETEPRIQTWAELLGGLRGAYYLTGEVDAEARQLIETTQHEETTLTLVSGALRLRRAGFLAEEAWRRYRHGKPEDFVPANTVPVYVKQGEGGGV
jgi:tRNA threonylcarbamoyladenosine biosynthesis protein TsaB